MKRIDVVRALSALVTEEDLFIGGMGELRVDWWNLRPGGPGKGNTFSPSLMGGHSAAALGLAVALPHRRVVALDTDGSLLLNTGVLCTLGNERPSNLTIMVFDNEIYESVGGPPTHTSKNTDLAAMAEGAGCINCYTVHEIDEFSSVAETLLTDDAFGLIVAKIQPGVYNWPAEKQRKTDGVEDKYNFLRHVERLEGIEIHGGAPQN